MKYKKMYLYNILISFLCMFGLKAQDFSFQEKETTEQEENLNQQEVTIDEEASAEYLDDLDQDEGFQRVKQKFLERKRKIEEEKKKYVDYDD